MTLPHTGGVMIAEGCRWFIMPSMGTGTSIAREARRGVGAYRSPRSWDIGEGRARVRCPCLARCSAQVLLLAPASADAPRRAMIALARTSATWPCPSSIHPPAEPPRGVANEPHRSLSPPLPALERRAGRALAPARDLAGRPDLPSPAPGTPERGPLRLSRAFTPARLPPACDCLDIPGGGELARAKPECAHRRGGQEPSAGGKRHARPAAGRPSMGSRSLTVSPRAGSFSKRP